MAELPRSIQVHFYASNSRFFRNLESNMSNFSIAIVDDPPDRVESPVAPSIFVLSENPLSPAYPRYHLRGVPKHGIPGGNPGRRVEKHRQNPEPPDAEHPWPDAKLLMPLETCDLELPAHGQAGMGRTCGRHGRGHSGASGLSGAHSPRAIAARMTPMSWAGQSHPRPTYSRWSSISTSTALSLSPSR